MKKLLIIGAGILQLPAIQKAKEMGFNVTVVDMCSQAPGIEYADRFYEVSTNDISGILQVADEVKPDGVMTLATDMPMRSVAAVAEKYGLHSISPTVAIKATDKIEMIRCFEAHNVAHPWFEVISSEQDLEELLKEHSIPFIMKPNDSSGSRGVVLVKNIHDMKEAFEYSKSVSKSGLVLVEEYMQGPEVSVEAMTIHGETTILAVTDKLTTGAPYFVEMGHSQPSQLPEHTVEQIKNLATKAIQAIGIDNSPSHVEIIVTAEGPKLVELGARLGGDCITTYLVPLSTGIDMVEASILLALGQEVCIIPKFQKGAAIRYAKCENGTLQQITGFEDALKDESIQHIEIIKREGDIVTSIHGSGDRIGYVIAQAETASKAIEASTRALSKIKFKIKEEA